MILKSKIYVHSRAVHGFDGSTVGHIVCNQGEVAIIDRDMIHSEDGGNLINDRVSACLDTVIGPDGLKIVGVDLGMVNEVFSPTALEVDAFGLDLELSIVIVLDQVGLADAFDLVDDGLRQYFFDQTK